MANRFSFSNRFNSNSVSGNRLISVSCQIQITTNPKAFRTIEQRLEKSTNKAIKYYVEALKKALTPIRSEVIKGNLRKRVAPYSKPGELPHSQTLELRNSIKSAITRNNGLIIARAYTDVSYAPSLELGGVTFFEPNRKHSKIWLVNFIKKTITIEARPLWLPILQRELMKLIDIIKRI